MPTNFLSLPGELRNNIYKSLLVLEKPSSCGKKQERMNLTTGLLRANKAVHHEARLILYTRNTFDFTDCSAREVTAFLEQIGRKNAGYIQSIQVDFPRFKYLDLQDIELGVESARIIAIFERECGGLRTCTMARGSASRMVAKLVGLHSERVKVNALALVDSHFRAIPSLGGIVVELDVENYSRSLRKEMRNLGWSINEKDEEFSSDEDHGY